ncbi:hypothetical protein GINT2_001214 [Glugoides intestinalis]
MAYNFYGNEQLKSAANQRIEAKIHNFLKISKFDMDFLGMTFSQRIISFIACLSMAVILFVYSLYKLVFFIISPTAFVIPYVLSNILFFFMFGFISGFKTYIIKLFSEKKRKFTMTFILTTLLTTYSAFFIAKWHYVLFFGLIQIFSFLSFIITFLPGGTMGLTNLLNMIIRM